MGLRNTPEQNRAAVAAHAQRLRDAGLIRVSLWIRPEDRARVMLMDARNRADNRPADNQQTENPA